MLSDEQLASTGLDEIRTLLNEQPPSDANLDLMSGWAGVVAIATAAIERSQARDLVAATARLVDEYVRVLGAQLEDELYARSLRKIGMAHGSTGISYALARAATVLDHGPARAAAQNLLEREEERTARRGGIGARVDGYGDWRTPARSWCWGTSGYLLARTSSHVEQLGTTRPEHIETSLIHTINAKRARSHLCCGEAGQLLALDTTARLTRDDRARAAADRLAAGLVAQVQADELFHFYSFCTVQPPGLFWGRAGIGYALCRLACPERVPNILLIE